MTPREKFLENYRRDSRNIGFNGPVTLSLASNPGGAALGGTVTVTAVKGLASFSGLSINNSDNGYAIRATSSGLTAATTDPLDVTTPGHATQLVVTTQPPGNVVAGTSFGLVVTAEDGFGTVDTSFNGSVTVENTNGGSPLATVTAVNGVATFSGLALAQASPAYSLSVAGNGLIGAATDSFAVSSAPASKLIVLGPFQAAPGSRFDLSVLAEDPQGNVDSTFNGPVTVALVNSPGGGALGGTLTVGAANGIADFADLSINNAASGYVIGASSSDLTNGATAPFTVSNDQLVVTNQPPSVVAVGQDFALTVAVEDDSGGLDSAFSGSVTIRVLDLQGNTVTVGGTLTVSAVNGVAAFSGLTIAQSGTYTLLAESNGLGGVAANNVSATVAAGTPHQRYVTAVYQDVLDRAPDPDGLAYWVSLLDTGTAVSRVAQAITHSAEYYADFVIKPAYLELLSRAADDAGVTYWTEQMQNGLTDQELEAGFAASDEFFANAGGNSNAVYWIDAIYKLLLGRSADSSGEQYWGGQLAHGQTRLQVALGIAGSQENNTQLINDDYFHYLGRAADPAGLAFWLGQFADGKTNEDIIAGFTGSDEYYKGHTSY